MALLPLGRFCLSFPVNARGPLPSSMAFTGIAGCVRAPERPRRCAAEKRNELAPPHCPSQARESHRSGPNCEVGSGQVGTSQCPLWVKSTGRSFGSLRKVFRPVNRLSDKALGLVSVAPAGGRYPLASFEVLVVREEVLDLAPRDFRQIGIVPDLCVALRELWNRHCDNFLVAAFLVRHLEHANWAHGNDGAWNDRPGIGNKYVARIAVRRERMRNSIVARIPHRRIEKAIHDERPRFLIHLIFYRLAADRYFDDRVYLFGRISADRDMVDIHQWLAASRLWLSAAAAGDKLARRSESRAPVWVDRVYPTNVSFGSRVDGAA